MLLTILIAGLVMGFASSLHCAGMCGPIGCALLMASPGPGSRLDPLLMLLTAQAGRISSYVLFGAAFGIFGAALYGVANFEAAHAVLQWAAAVTIIWMGLSIAGLVPAMAGFDRLLAPLAGALAGARRAQAGAGYSHLAVAGVIWGFTPCAMVYAALFNSLLAGSPGGGMVMMAGFGLGTLPAVTLASLGIYRLGRLTASPKGRLLAGGGLAAAGVLGLLLTAPGSPLCLMR